MDNRHLAKRQRLNVDGFNKKPQLHDIPSLGDRTRSPKRRTPKRKGEQGSILREERNVSSNAAFTQSTQDYSSYELVEQTKPRVESSDEEADDEGQEDAADTSEATTTDTSSKQGIRQSIWGAVEYVRDSFWRKTPNNNNEDASATKSLESGNTSKMKAGCTKQQNPQSRGPGHVMISYQWDSQGTMIKVRDKLQLNGYKVWMDVDNMSGSILESMSDAVENASVVLVCMSKKYKNSRNCRTEGEYAFNNKKPLIPILVEEGYKADGWLGGLIGTRLYIDLSSQEKLENDFPKLLKELIISLNKK